MMRLFLKFNIFLQWEYVFLSLSIQLSYHFWAIFKVRHSAILAILLSDWDILEKGEKEYHRALLGRDGNLRTWSRGAIEHEIQYLYSSMIHMIYEMSWLPRCIYQVARERAEGTGKRGGRRGKGGELPEQRARAKEDGEDGMLRRVRSRPHPSDWPKVIKRRMEMNLGVRKT
jgi:hypothetical protein